MLIYILYHQLKASGENGSGVYLLTNSIVSLLTLLYALFFRISHVRQSRTNQIEIKLNRVLCKSLPYILNALSRTSPWLLAYVAGERALVALFITNKYINKIKSPLSACIFSLLLIVCTCATSSPLITQHDIIIDPSDDNSVWCVQTHRFDSYEILLSFFVYIGPFIINCVCAIVIIIQITRIKANVRLMKRSTMLIYQLKQRQELIISPFVCLLCELPQVFIVLFVNSCQQYQQNVFRYGLLTIYYISYFPQAISFPFYVIMSPLFKREFSKTNIGKHLISKNTTTLSASSHPKSSKRTETKKQNDQIKTKNILTHKSKNEKCRKEGIHPFLKRFSFITIKRR
ncbi:unnamed protein product [Didymodactylos carnosus]|uniref:G-protein coupled receptors family 1 profile domain-containing protein n=1 Tax=Didymodactylos carnosus TaxID=1234261 RepID=A0A814U3A7_9BILA|nr:unnamed protein product [Didymodactylos carnosus]CAF3934080.1 unnamed protein product [Didymodactylos carnosus]